MWEQLSSKSNLVIKLEDEDDKVVQPFTASIGTTACETHKEHANTYTGDQQYVGDIRNKTFTESSDMCSKKFVHTDEDHHVFDIVPKNGLSSAAMDIHNQEVGRIHTDEKGFVSSLCNKRFINKQKLRRHEVHHTAIRRFECGVCNKRFARPSHLLQHELIHTGERRHVCGTCYKAFAELSSLRKHELIHTGEHKHVCGLCNKAFTRSSSLHRHEQIHTGERSHVCGTCNKAFAESSTQRQHELIHTGEHKYVCGSCSKAFISSSSLRKHEVMHAAEHVQVIKSCSPSSILHQNKLNLTCQRWFVCLSCNNRFRTRSLLHTHELICQSAIEAIATPTHSKTVQDAQRNKNYVRPMQCNLYV